jgi:alpha-tubulin suppressor-like RCC1 family protein
MNVFLGHRSTCYLGAGGTRWCAGQNDTAQLGLGDMNDHSTPGRVADGDGWTRLALFFYGESEGVRAETFYSWGGSKLLPVANGPASAVRAVLGDLSSQCDWETDGTAPGCAGAGATVWHSLDYGADHMCGVRESDRTLWCWGTNYSGALGNGALSEGAMVANAAQVGTATDWEQVGTGGNSVDGTGLTCALNMNGGLYCFGHPSLTATNGVDVGAVPTQVSTDSWAWVDVDWEHACAGKLDGHVFCWGADTYGGYVAPGLRSAAVPVAMQGTFERWLMGGHHACGQSGGRWKCMGWNEQGQLANGTTGGTGEFVDLCP